MTSTKRHLVYLTGFMGSGKSTIAPILANTLGYAFLDIDKEIETMTGKTVANIFLEDGERHFRTVERELLERTAAKHRCVISLGGGTITHEGNAAFIKSSGLLVYLKADVEHIFRRMRHKTDRPLLRSDDGAQLTDEQLRNRIQNILALREPFYNQADIIIETNSRRVGLTVDDIVRAITPLIE
jgi:shikimate kinase